MPQRLCTDAFDCNRELVGSHSALVDRLVGLVNWLAFGALIVVFGVPGFGVEPGLPSKTSVLAASLRAIGRNIRTQNYAIQTTLLESLSVPQSEQFSASSPWTRLISTFKLRWNAFRYQIAVQSPR